MATSKKRTKWFIGLLAGVFVLLIVLKMTGVLGGEKDITVAVEEITPRDIIETVNASGKIYPETEIKIKADVSGEIVELPIEEGDSVVRGQLLVKINASIYNSAVEQAAASTMQAQSSVSNAKEMAAQAKAQMDRAKANYERNQKLFQDKVISKMEFEQMQTDYLSSKASYEAALANINAGKYGVEVSQANLNQAKENQRRTTIVAPASGIVSQLLVKKGERVVGTQQMDGSQIMTIADMGRMELRVDVIETDIAKVGIGDSCIVEIDAYRNTKFKGVVSKISVSSVSLNNAGSMGQSTNISDQVTNYTVHVLLLPVSDQDLSGTFTKGKFPFKPGMSANVAIQTRKESKVIACPINAVTTRDLDIDNENQSNEEEGKKKNATSSVNQVVFVLNSNTNTVEKRAVKTGIQDNEYIQILSGLNKGEKVVVAPYGTITRILKDEMRVKVVPKDQIYSGQND